MIKPITPDECQRMQMTMAPDWVIEIFNSLIAIKWDGVKAIIYEDEFRARVEESDHDFDEARRRGFFKINPLYNSNGWSVKESYDTDLSEDFWEFTIKKS